MDQEFMVKYIVNLFEQNPESFWGMILNLDFLRNQFGKDEFSSKAIQLELLNMYNEKKGLKQILEFLISKKNV